MALAEKKVIHSFNHVKEDITDIKSSLEILKHTQEAILKKLSAGKPAKRKHKKKAKPSPAKKHRAKPNRQKKVKSPVPRAMKRMRYVAQKGGKKFHKKNCPYAQNIKPKNKIIFKSKNRALNNGYKPCACVK